jgi:hypothetical protein
LYSEAKRLFAEGVDQAANPSYDVQSLILKIVTVNKIIVFQNYLTIESWPI